MIKQGYSYNLYIIPPLDTFDILRDYDLAVTGHGATAFTKDILGSFVKRF